MKVHLSDGEWKLMNKLWDASPRTITELTAALREETGWSKNTVITMLSRLDAKQAVYYEEGLRASLRVAWASRRGGGLRRGADHCLVGSVDVANLARAQRGPAVEGGGHDAPQGVLSRG